MLPTAFFAIFTTTAFWGLTALYKWHKAIGRMLEDLSDLQEALLTHKRLTAPGCRDCTEKAPPSGPGNKRPADHVIVLWWGPDGLRLNEDGSTEWIRLEPTESRKAARCDPGTVPDRNTLL